MKIKILPLIVLVALAATSSRGQRIVEVSNLTALQSRQFLSNETVRVKGYSTAGDWGEPRDYFWRTNVATVTNAVMFPAVGGGSYWHPWKDASVQVFGAFPDDGVDDTTAIQSAANYVKTTRQTLYFPSGASGGIYNVSNTIVLTNDVNNRPTSGGIRGDGIGRSRILHTGYNQSVVKMRGLGMVVDGLTIGYSNIQGVTNTAAISLDLSGYNSSFDIRNFQLVNAYAGCKATADDSGYSTFSCIFQNGIVENCDQGFDMPSGSGNIYHNIYVFAYGLPYATRALIDRSGISRYDQFNVEHSNFRNTPVVLQGSGGSFGHLHVEGIRLLNSEGIIAVQQSTCNIDQMTLINSYFNGHILSAITRNGTNATATINDLSDAITGGHGLMVGDSINISGATDALYNGVKTVLTVTTTNFTYGMGGTPAADAVVDLAGGYDYLSVNRSSSAASSLTDTVLYENPRLVINSLKPRDNRIINAQSANRNGLLLVNELSGRTAEVTINNIDTGGPSDPLAGRYLAAVPVVGVSASGNIATVYTRTPHLFSTNELAYFQANTAGIRTTTNWTVLTVPDPWTFTVAITNSTAINLTREIGGGFASPVVAQITNLSRSGNIATAICNGSHYLKEGYKLSVYNTGVTNTFNTTTAVALSIPSANTFTYRSIGADTAAFTESQAVVAVFDAGISEFLVTSTHRGLKNAGHLYKASTCLASNTIAASSYDLTTNTVNGARIGDRIALSPLSAANWNVDIQVTADCLANNSIVITRRNVSTNSIASNAGIWVVHMTRP